MKIIFLFFALLIHGCVGTVEDKKPKTTKALSKDPLKLTYAGVESVVAIADTKVEVFFFPATFDSSKVTYKITYDGLQIPITVPGLNLRPNYRGVLSYTVNGLNSNTVYSFQVEIFDSEELVSESTQIRSTKTFSNLTADFQGVGGVYNRTGADGMTSILVDWSLAKNLGTISSPAEIDVTDYTVTILDSNQLTPGDMNNDFYGTPKRRVVQVSKANRSVIVNGLSPDTKYFFQVRANHYGSLLFSGDANYKKEQNTKYLELSTLSADLASYDFNTDGLVLTLPAGGAGLSSINASWDAGKGAFESYRIYYKKKEDAGMLNLHTPEVACIGREGATDIFCKKVPYTVLSTAIPDLDSNTDYEVVVVLCQTASCGVGERIISSIKAITTTPTTALFNGIDSIEPAKNANNLDEIYLNITPPALDNGIMHGLFIEYQGPPAGSPTVLNNPLVANLTGLSVVNFDFETATELIITGINPLSTDQYCFLVYPFTFDGIGGVIEHRGVELSTCITPSIKAPTSLEFSGGSGCNVDVTGNINVQWSKPSSGVYSHFDVFYTTGFFEFATAVGSYNFETVPSTGTQTTLSSLASGVYNIGVLTYFNSLGVIKRSEFNSNIMTCTVP